MSWLARSFANSLRLDGDGDDLENDVASVSSRDPSPSNRIEQDIHLSTEVEESQARGVKEDLTELRQSLSQQLWGVASFLAPPPPPPPPPPISRERSLVSNLNKIQSEPSDLSEEGEGSESEETSRIKQDFVEIGGRFRTEISKMASNYFPFGSNEIQNEIENEGEELETEGEYEDWDETAIGITDEVLAFARNIAMHPETWLDFPLDIEDDLDDFHMSIAQRDHALAIERLAPRLAALRIELCPCHMADSYFWKVYFVLLHSRLYKHDAEILSTTQVMEARTMWMQELHKQTKPENDWYGKSTTYENDNSNVRHGDIGYARTYGLESRTSTTEDYETEKHPIVSTETQFIDKTVVEEIKHENKDLCAGTSPKAELPDYEDDDDDDWPEDEDLDLGSYKATIPLGNEDDFSFSDLEDDTNSSIPIKSKIHSKDTEISTT